MGKGSGVTRGDRRRNERLAELRALLPPGNAIAGLDLGEKKQALAVIMQHFRDHATGGGGVRRLPGQQVLPGIPGRAGRRRARGVTDADGSHRQPAGWQPERGGRPVLAEQRAGDPA